MLSTGNDWIELNLERPGVTLIIGENGTGKSILLDCITFALYGKPYRKINKPQLVNSINKRDCVVEVWFRVGSSDYMIRRGIRPNIFEVWQDDILWDKSGDQQDELEKRVIRCTLRAFRQVVVLGSATFQPFMQLPAWQRREVIEDLLDLQVFGAMKDVLKKRIQDNEKILAEQRIKLNLISNYIRLDESDAAKRKAQLEVDVEEKHVRINTALKEIEKLDQQLTQINIPSEQMINDILSKIKEAERYKNELIEYKAKIEAKRDLLKKELKFFDDHTSCPTCKQEISLEHKDTMSATRTETISECNSGLELLDNRYVATIENLKQLNRNRDIALEIKQSIELIESRRRSLNEYIKEVTENITSLKKREDENRRLDERRTELSLIKEELKTTEDERAVLDTANTLLSDSGVKAVLIKKYVPFINQRIAHYLQRTEFMCTFELNENFEERVLSRHMDEFSYESFSEGQKQRIDLSLLFTWRDVARLRRSVNTNLLVLDEVFDKSLDAGGIDLIDSLIRELASDHKVIVISHRDQMVDRYSDTVRFKLRNRFSELEER